MQRSRRNDPYPFTWEIPAAIIAGVLLVLVFGVHIGRAAANVLAGAGWAWPAREELFRSLPAILGGDGGAGLPRALHGGAGQSALWTSISVCELLLLIRFGWTFKAGLDGWGPHRVQASLECPAEQDQQEQ